jgi:DNA-binding NarL/FixJ family response regulator
VGLPRPRPDDRTAGQIRLVLADDRERTRRALRALLGTWPELLIVGEASDGAAAIELVARVQPDVVIMDLCMPVLDGLQATGPIKQRWPWVRVVILSVSADARAQALAAGADAFVAKGDPEDGLLGVVRGIARTARD